MKIYSNGKMLEVGGGQTQDIYSLEERVVGRWIDGRPLYQKTYTNISVPGVDAESTIITFDFDVDIVDIWGQYKFGNEKKWKFPNRYTYVNTTNNSVNFYNQSAAGGGTTIICNITVNYTKTTDQPTIELPAALTVVQKQTLFTAAPQSAASVTLDTGIKNEEV